MSHRAYPKTRLHLPRFVGGPVEPVRHVVADEDHAGAAVRRRAGLPAHAQRGAEGVEPLFHEGLSHLLRAHVRLVDHQEFTERIVSLAFNKLFFSELQGVNAMVGWVNLDMVCSTILPSYPANSAKSPSALVEPWQWNDQNHSQPNPCP